MSPDPDAAAAVGIAVTSSGAFSQYETRELIAPEDLPAVLEKAARARESYRPPGTSSQGRPAPRLTQVLGDPWPCPSNWGWLADR